MNTSSVVPAGPPADGPAKTRRDAEGKEDGHQHDVSIEEAQQKDDRQGVGGDASNGNEAGQVVEAVEMMEEGEDDGDGQEGGNEWVEAAGSFLGDEEERRVIFGALDSFR